MSFTHPFDFDPTYGYSVEALLSVEVPPPPTNFERFWQRRYQRARAIAPRPTLVDIGDDEAGRRVFEITYRSTDGIEIQGWLTLAADGIIDRGFVVGHGYGGRMAPDHLDFERSAILYLCCRGLGKSTAPPISSNPWWHVLHDIDKRERYVHGGCVEDTWLATSALLRLFPQIEGRIGYLGTSFGGGIGALAVAWDPRIRRAHFNVPSFGNHALRLALPSTGSAASVQRFAERHPDMVRRTLAYYDAATAARYIQIPVHCALALFDPVVAPPGQFAVYNGLAGPKQLFTLSAGHFDYPEKAEESEELMEELHRFFSSFDDPSLPA